MNDPSFLNYGQTVLRFETGLDIDLRTDLSGDDVDAVLGLGLGPEFAVITAYNPHGRGGDEDGDVGDDDNERRQDRLLDEVRALNVPFQRVAGRSPDGEHCEDSVAVAMPLADACRLGARFGQTAIYWFDGGRFMLRGAAEEFEPVAMPASRDELRRHQP